MMNSLPKVLPSWHDLALQDIVGQKGNWVFEPLYPPDYGGVGVDINVNSNITCIASKYSKSLISFSADKCSLPFLPLKQIRNWSDPCLKSLEDEKLNFDKFSLKLTTLRNLTGIKSFRTKLKKIQEEIKNITYDKQDEVNILAPKGLVHLADTLPKRTVIPNFNVSYAGGTLAVCKSSNKQFFIYPSCEKLNKLCITPLLEGSGQHFTPDFSEEMTVKLKNEPILQVNQALDGICVRQKNTFHLVNLANMMISSKTVHKPKLYHISSNPYNPMEILSVYEKGMMKLRNMITEKTVWSMSDDEYDDPCLLCPTWQCSFGSHPFSALCLNSRNLYSFDFREWISHPRAIFSAKNPSMYVGEELACLKQWNKNMFQYFLTSNNHLILCDERYPKTAVMYWNHCLNNPPIYLECADLNSNVSIIVIATQKSPQLASFLCSRQVDIQPVSLSSPLLLSSPSDCLDSLKFHCYYVDDTLSSRFSLPLTGVCVVPHNSETDFTVLQSNSLGDIFYQDYKHSSNSSERTYHVSTGCTLTPPEKILPHLNKLISGCDSDEMVKNVDEVFKDTDEAIVHMQINIAKILSPPREISANCALCRLSSTADDKELVLSETCPTCNLSRAESEHFSKAVANESLLIGPISEESGFLECDIDYLSKFEDNYSKRILSIWLDSNNVEDNQGVEVQDMPLT